MRARDVFQNLVDEDDGNGEPKHRAPLFVVERGDGERLREGWDVHDDEMEPHADATDPKHIIIITNSHEPLSVAKPSRAILADADQKIVRPRTVATMTMGLSNL